MRESIDREINTCRDVLEQTLKRVGDLHSAWEMFSPNNNNVLLRCLKYSLTRGERDYAEAHYIDVERPSGPAQDVTEVLTILNSAANNFYDAGSNSSPINGPRHCSPRFQKRSRLLQINARLGRKSTNLDA